VIRNSLIDRKLVKIAFSHWFWTGNVALEGGKGWEAITLAWIMTSGWGYHWLLQAVTDILNGHHRDRA